MNVFFELIANLLAIIYAAVPNYAIAIIGLTLAIMIVMTPLTLKGTRSMMVMQQLQPEMKKIQTRYKDDRQKLNEELLKFYKENDISPLGGCLPLLVQMPIFLVLYQVLRGLTRRISGMGFDTGWVSGQLGTGTGTTKPPSIDRNFDPAFLNHNSKMYTNLSNTNTMQAFGMDLAESAKTALSQGVLHATPYLLLIVIVGITGFIQQRQIQGRNPNQQTNPQQQMIMKVMPIFLPVISFGLPAGLVLYFAVSNLYRVGQQWFISRSIYGAQGTGSSGGSSGPAEPAPAPAGLLASIKRAAPGRFATHDDDDAEASSTGGRANGDKTSGAKKSGGRTATKTPAKTPAKTSAKTPAKANSRSTTKTAAKPTPKAAPKPSGRATPSKKATAAKSSGGDAGSPSSTPPASSKGSAAGPQPGPTLQPRARKNKKE